VFTSGVSDRQLGIIGVILGLTNLVVGCINLKTTRDLKAEIDYEIDQRRKHREDFSNHLRYLMYGIDNTYQLNSLMADRIGVPHNVSAYANATPPVQAIQPVLPFPNSSSQYQRTEAGGFIPQSKYATGTNIGDANNPQFGVQR